MRWLVTGAGGQLGSHLMQLLPADDVVGVTRAQLDITSRAAVDRMLDAVRPDVVVNAAAYTAVDNAERDETAALLLNGTSVGYLAEAAARAGARLIHVSTDYVFDGAAAHPYEPGDPPNPVTAYGRTKLIGEQLATAAGAHVVRTAWVYGGPSPNFVDTMLRLAASRPTVDVVTDQVGSPTYARDLAAALIELGSSSVPAAILHYANSGQASWFDLAREVFRLSGHDPERVRSVTSEQFVRPAKRPAWSVLSLEGWTAHGLTAPRAWQTALRSGIEACGANGG